MTIEVLNGTVGVGDRIAYATSGHRYGGAMRIGTVLEVREKSIKVRIEQTSGYHFGNLPYIKTLPYPASAVKLAAASE